ncbi:hypothetical protein LCGC14_2752080, partial [marine sediment metagenome]
DLGPNTGCMGNLVWAVDKPQKDKLVENLKKLGPFLKAAGYKGPIDLNTIVTSGSIFALEVTARLGYDAIEALYEILDPQDLGELFANLGRDSGPVDLPVKQGVFGIALRLTVPPYPFRKADKRDKGLPILGVPESFEHFYLTDVFLNNNLLQWSASDGVLMKVGASGKSVKTAISDVYERASLVRAEGLQYRTDIAGDADRSIAQLKKWGYLPNDSLLRRAIA